MRHEQIQISDVEYNPARSAFEATISIHDASGTTRYPCSLPAPLNASFETVTRGLVARAKQRHRKNLPGLRSRIADQTAKRAALTADAILNMIVKRAA
ncbi:hypothetical protein [Aliiroseovarius sp. YM-037]|uniref:hypothetical protein n=1 Tax=Aliiroseovarius sp. YM-037 TaxID=3341728 RepID=UPI003A802514